MPPELPSLPLLPTMLICPSALKLSPFESAQLIDALWQSLDLTDQAAIDQAWLAESRNRLGAFQRGDIEAVDGATALSALKDQLAP